jgi:type IV secretory pathway VirB10-like protein
MAAGPLPSAARVTTVMPPPAPARQRFILPAALAGVALLVVVGFLAWRVLVDGSSGRGPTPPATAARGIVADLTQTTAVAATTVPPTPIPATATTAPTVTTVPTATSVPPTAAPDRRARYPRRG